MSYRPQDLMPGDIVLVTHGTGSAAARLLDALIAWSTASPFVHSCIVGDGHLVNPVWRVQRDRLDLYRLGGWAMRVQATEEQRLAAVRWAESRVGAPYGVEEILVDFARFDLHWVQPSWYRWRPGRYTCSGFVTAAYASQGVIVTLAPAPAPSDLSFSPLLLGPRPWDTAQGRRPAAGRQRGSRIDL